MLRRLASQAHIGSAADALLGPPQLRPGRCHARAFMVTPMTCLPPSDYEDEPPAIATARASPTPPSHLASRRARLPPPPPPRSPRTKAATPQSTISTAQGGHVGAAAGGMAALLSAGEATETE